MNLPPAYDMLYKRGLLLNEEREDIQNREG